LKRVAYEGKGEELKGDNLMESDIRDSIISGVDGRMTMRPYGMDEGAIDGRMTMRPYGVDGEGARFLAPAAGLERRRREYLR
jgi:hypothetical protein